MNSQIKAISFFVIIHYIFVQIHYDANQQSYINSILYMNYIVDYILKTVYRL